MLEHSYMIKSLRLGSGNRVPNDICSGLECYPLEARPYMI
jgi:hypothetical protein